MHDDWRTVWSELLMPLRAQSGYPLDDDGPEEPPQGALREYVRLLEMAYVTHVWVRREPDRRTP
jgi:hypothetical protein